ncbi:hypothetical protein PVL29_007509 [Vitis rotundifolia]|uniref:Ubiquitin fusion degradation protein 1 homolog n=1 Tax=Vitis rotundifolia TaxID=103349 RepID=A0AA39A105_VITRO|nr:hypothetical protein PVL29_007509 [Vitis rotundifolia]
MSYGYFYDDDLPIFKQIYHCLPASSLNKPQLELGDKIIMPASALDLLTKLEISFPMLFKLKNPASGRVTHCGVLEFTAEECTMHLPSWMMENLLLEEGDMVKVKNVSLPAGTYMQLQPHTKNFLDITNPRAMLETKLRSFSCLTTGDTIVIDYNNKKFYIDIVDTKPSAAVCIIDTDCEVDFAPPLDYEEAEEPKPSNLSSKTKSRESSETQSEELATKLIKFKPFTGSARRLDGKPISESVAVVSSSPMPQQLEDTDGTNGPTSSSSTTFQRSRKVVFGSKGTPEAAPMAGQKHPQEVEKPKFQAFTGKKYTLQD